MNFKPTGSKMATALAVAVTASAIAITSADSASALFIGSNGVIDVTISGGLTSSVPGVTTFNFESLSNGPIPTAPNVQSLGGGVTLNQASTPSFPVVTGSNILPSLTTGKNLVVADGTATFTFPSGSDSLLTYFGLLWKTINPTNQINFFNGNALVDTVTGAQVRSAFGLTGGDFDISFNPAPTQYVNFFANPLSARFNRIELADPVDLVAFQVDNVSYNVPTPALLPGLIALGVGVLRKRKAEATAEAES